MDRRFTPFAQGFDSSDGTAERVRARVDPVTNSLRMRVPADERERMAVAAAFISREEFLHGEWVVAAVHTLGHLSLAADDALECLLEEGHDTGSSRTRDYANVIDACQRTQAALLEPMKPFVEAVDKFQLLSVIDEEFVNAVRTTYEAAADVEATEAFDESFYDEYEQEVQVATGQRVPEGEDVYVNPLYFHALGEIVTTDWGDRAGETGTNGRAQGRAIAEAVARATLDVPSPVEPLGSTAFDWFEPLATPGVDVDSVSVDELTSDERYSMSRGEFERYLRDCYRGSGDDNQENGATSALVPTGELAFEYTYEQARESWVARVFVNVRKALDSFRDRGDIDLGTVNPDELRRLLVERVHGVDTETTATMREHPTALLDVPRQVETDVPDDDVMSAEGKPLPKVLLEAFEQHGSFGAVVYNLTADDVKYQLNWHARDQPVDDEAYQHVPAGIEDYSDLWHHYYCWEGIRQQLDHARNEYREDLIDRLTGAFETPAECERHLGQVVGRRAELEGRPATDASVAADNRRIGAEEPLADAFEAFEERTTEAEIQALLTEWSTGVLRELADELGVSAEPSVEEVECPLCNVRAGGCGKGGEDCANEALCRTAATRFPALVDELTALGTRRD